MPPAPSPSPTPSRPVRRLPDRDPTAHRTIRYNAHADLDPGTYFLVLECVHRMCSGDVSSRVPDSDAVTDVALARVQAGRASVASPDRYDAWVAVVCKNAYLNFIRARRTQRSIELADAVHDPLPALEACYDAAVLRDVLLVAIERLPEFLREVARLRFAEDWSHAAIARRTGKALPTVRSYANKAATRLRNDTRLVRVLEGWRD